MDRLADEEADPGALGGGRGIVSRSTSRYTRRPPVWADRPFAVRAYRSLTGQEPPVLERLEGGFQNANFRVGEQVLRLYSTGADTARREASVLRVAAQAGVPVPSCLRVAQFEGRGVMLQQFVAGRAWGPGADYHHLGRTLARLHGVEFPGAGLFRPDGSLETRPADFGQSLLRQFLEGRAGSRLDRATCRSLMNLEPPPAGVVALVHSDFNAKNILADESGRVAAVLDWEFAMVNDPLIDLANFFRFESDHTSPERERFLRGYEQGGGLLPPGWRRSCLLHDLVSLVAFLDAPEELPETFHTARQLIRRSLDELHA